MTVTACSGDARPNPGPIPSPVPSPVDATEATGVETPNGLPDRSADRNPLDDGYGVVGVRHLIP